MIGYLKRALTVLFVMLPAMASAQSWTRGMPDGTSLRVTAPAQYCSVDRNRPFEEDIWRQWSAGGSPIIIGMANCRELSELRQGTRGVLTHHIIIRHMSSQGSNRLTRLQIPLQQFIREMANSLNRASISPNAIQNNVNEWLRRADTELRQSRVGQTSLGFYGSDDVAAYLAGGLVGETVMSNGTTYTDRRAMVGAFTLAAEWPIAVYAYTEYLGPQSFDVSKAMARDIAVRLINDNRSPAPQNSVPLPPGTRPFGR